MGPNDAPEPTISGNAEHSEARTSSGELRTRDLGPLDLLNAFQHVDVPRLRLWIKELLTHDRAAPDCPGAEDQAPHLRLLQLCDYRDPALKPEHRLVQEHLRTAAWQLCGYYRPAQDGGYLGAELLYFARATYAFEAVRAFSGLLAARAFDSSDPQQLNLWLNAHWVVADMLPDWGNIEGWVMRDADGTTRAQGASAGPLASRLSAIGIWTHYGPSRTFPDLIVAALRLLPFLLPRASAYEAHLFSTFTRHIVALHARTLDEHIPFSHLLPCQGRDPEYGYPVAHVRHAWAAFSRHLARQLVPDMKIASLRTAKIASERFERRSKERRNAA